MNNEFGCAYFGQIVAKEVMHKSLNTNVKKKKASIFTRVVKKLTN